MKVQPILLLLPITAFIVYKFKLKAMGPAIEKLGSNLINYILIILIALIIKTLQKNIYALP